MNGKHKILILLLTVFVSCIDYYDPYACRACMGKGYKPKPCTSCKNTGYCNHCEKGWRYCTSV